jgi:hypothetical protein
LNAFACGPNDGGDLDTAVNASEQLQQNMAEEVRTKVVSMMDWSWAPRGVDTIGVAVKLDACRSVQWPHQTQ